VTFRSSGERRRRENQGAEWGRIWGGVSPPQPTRGSGERRELPQRGSGRSSGRKRILDVFLAHITRLADTFGPKLTLFGAMWRAACCAPLAYVVYYSFFCFRVVL